MCFRTILNVLLSPHRQRANDSEGSEDAFCTRSTATRSYKSVQDRLLARYPRSSSGRRDRLTALELKMKVGSHARGQLDLRWIDPVKIHDKSWARIVSYNQRDGARSVYLAQGEHLREEAATG